ncbi:MAG: pullulanase-associated domain-containing protein, partial [Athalassotoga sp.]
MKRYFLFLSVLILITLTFTVAFSAYASLSAGKTATDFDAKTVLIIHYHRYDGNYSGWNLWVWPYRPESLAGAAYQFTGEDSYGPYAIIKFDQKYTQLGFIVRLNDWQAKDVSEDRHVVIPSSGVAEIWVLEGQYEWYTNPNDVDISPRAMGAFLNSLNKVDLYLTNPIE